MYNSTFNHKHIIITYHKVRSIPDPYLHKPDHIPDLERRDRIKSRSTGPDLSRTELHGLTLVLTIPISSTTSTYQFLNISHSCPCSYIILVHIPEAKVPRHTGVDYISSTSLWHICWTWLNLVHSSAEYNSSIYSHTSMSNPLQTIIITSFPYKHHRPTTESPYSKG